jgi:hypothetical protein
MLRVFLLPKKLLLGQWQDFDTREATVPLSPAGPSLKDTE